MPAPTTTNLLSAIQAKIPSPRLIQITNPANPDATTLNPTVLSEAAQDAALFFEREARINYDDNNVGHVSICWQGVISFLYAYAGQVSPTFQETISYFEKQCAKFFEANFKRFRTNSVITNSSPDAHDPYWSENSFNKIRPK